MEIPTWVLSVTRSFTGLLGTVRLALAGQRTLLAPEVAYNTHRSGDVRARLAREPRARVDHLLEALLLRARLRKGPERLSLLRSLALLAPTRSQATYIAQRASRFDDEFRALIIRADAARDRQNWAEGIEAYSQALSLYEDHAGYLLQRSHCYKEQREYAKAEMGYRDALALGAEVDHVWPHLEHVVLRQKGINRLYPPEVAELLARPDGGARREEMVTSSELRAMAWLLMGIEKVETDWLLSVMRGSPMRDDAIKRLLSEPEFFSANRALVGLAGREGNLL